MRRYALALALIAGACTDAGPTATAPIDTTTTPSGLSTSSVITGPTANIQISGFSFGSQQTVSAGTTVIATNDDPVSHTWTSADDLWDSGRLGNGDSFAFKFEEPGTYSFVCNIHTGQMGGSIVVEA